MGFDQGTIVLDSPNGSYFAGQTIFGKLQFQQDKVKTFRGIYVKVKGKAEVHWTTQETRRRNDRSYTETIVHSAEEEFFNTKVYLVGSDHGEYTLQPGKHEFPFQCPIPADSPTSFDGEYGYIHYTVKAVVDRKFKTDQEKSIPIRVIAQKDLNLIPRCKDPLQFDFEETYCCWCTQSGVCDTVVKLPVSGCCPGQVIPVELSCANKGGVEISEIKMKIFRRTTFFAEHNPDTRKTDENLCSVKKGPIPGDTSRNWVVEMEIPRVDVLNVDACRIIEVEYFFKVQISVSGCHKDSEEKQLITFGDIPMVGYEYWPNNTLQLTNAQDNNEIKASIPLVNTPYPGSHPTVITTQPYPGSDPTVLSPYPTEGVLGANSPYPGANSPYPGANPPNTGANSPYPGANSPYPGANSPYPAANSPYPGANSPYPAANSPYPGANSPYPGANSPYPGANPPFPGANPVDNHQPPTNSPYPANPSFSPAVPGYPPAMPMPALPKSPALGFKLDNEKQAAAPLMPYPATPRAASPYTAATAPEAGGDNTATSKPTVPDTPTQEFPYNPDFMTADKK